MKKMLFTITMSLILFSCSNNSRNSDTTTTVQEPVKLTVSELLENPDEYVGQQIIVSGTVDHVCRNGGKKMFIIGNDADDRLKINTGDKISVFEVDLEGDDVTVEGIFNELRIDEEYLAKWEDELNNEKKEHAEHSGSGEHSGEEENAEGTDQITVLRNQIKESGEDCISQYSIECNKYPSKK